MTRQNEIERLAQFMGWERAIWPYDEIFWAMEGNDNKDPSKFKRITNFDPFTRLEDAFLVAEKIRESGIPFILESHGDIGAPGRWWAYFQMMIGDRSINGYGSEAPKAIALAALAYLDARENKK